jgi:hypothetical protein
MEVQGGSLELSIDGDLFKAEIRLNIFVFEDSSFRKEPSPKLPN